MLMSIKAFHSLDFDLDDWKNPIPVQSLAISLGRWRVLNDHTSKPVSLKKRVNQVLILVSYLRPRSSGPKRRMVELFHSFSYRESSTLRVDHEFRLRSSSVRRLKEWSARLNQWTRVETGVQVRTIRFRRSLNKVKEWSQNLSFSFHRWIWISESRKRKWNYVEPKTRVLNMDSPSDGGGLVHSGFKEDWRIKAE